MRDNELPNIARIGALIGNPVRALMLNALMDGSERPASELASMANATPQAASAHLANLVSGGLLDVTPHGRHRYYRLRNADVATAIEVLSLTASAASIAAPRAAPELQQARRCYDHLAGRLGVAICDALIARQHLIAGGDGWALSESGHAWLASVRLAPPSASRRPLVRPCLDWTERRPHLAGWLGAALCQRLEQQGAVRRRGETRALEVTPTGRRLLSELFDLAWR